MTLLNYVCIVCITFLVPFSILSLWGTASKKVTVSILCAYIAVAFSATVLSRESYPEYRYQLIPLWSYTNLAGSLRNGFFLQVLSNIIGFIPIGILIFVLTGDFKRSVLYCLIVSICIEFAQLVLKKGLFEIDDLLHNTLGGACGCLLYKHRSKILNILRKIKESIRRVRK